MGTQSELQSILETLVGSRNVYFQPPPNVQMRYPCIVYKREFVDTKFANNSPYALKKRYSVTVIDRDPNSPIPDRVAQLPLCVYDRHFQSDNLNHDIFRLYF